MFQMSNYRIYKSTNCYIYLSFYRFVEMSTIKRLFDILSLSAG